MNDCRLSIDTPQSPTLEIGNRRSTIGNCRGGRDEHTLSRPTVRVARAAAQSRVRSGRHPFVGSGDWSQRRHLQPCLLFPVAALASPQRFRSDGGSVAIPWREPGGAHSVLTCVLPGFRRPAEEEPFLRRLNRLPVFRVWLRAGQGGVAPDEIRCAGEREFLRRAGRASGAGAWLPC